MLSAPIQMLLVAIAGWMNGQQRQVIDYLLEENRVLRELHGTRKLRLNDDQRRRLAVRGKTLGRRLLAGVASIVTPDTILRWHRQLIARKYDGSASRRRGRPRVMETIRSLVIQMASENVRWGYSRIVGELAKLGHEVSRSTVRRILKEHGIEPAPERSKRMPWKTFLKAHWDGIAAADFFTVEVWTRIGLVRHAVLFVIDLPTRRVEIAGIAPLPDGFWMEQIARNLVDGFTGCLRTKRFLIHDRDPLFTRDFVEILEHAGVASVRLPARSPNLNAYAERFVLSIKSECLDHVVLIGEQHLRHAIAEFVEHYHEERPHQGLGNRPLTLCESDPCGDSIARRSRLGGLLSHYHRKAA